MDETNNQREIPTREELADTLHQMYLKGMKGKKAGRAGYLAEADYVLQLLAFYGIG